MAYFGAHVQRALAILTAAHGDTDVAIPLGHFRLPAGDLETAEPDASERAVDASIPSSAPLGGHNNPLDGREFRTSPLLVRVAYRHHAEGTLDDGVDARLLGGATRTGIEARASEDAALIERAVGWQPNWVGLDPAVIDCAPGPEGWALTDPIDGRMTLVVPFILTTRATSPGAYGPTAT